MSQRVNTFSQFLPLAGGSPGIIVKNQCYFSLTFLGGNYYSRGNIFQRIFGGRDEVALIAGMRLPPDGNIITATEEPNIVLDKRAIRPGQVTNIPLVLNMLVNMPAYMESIGFSFKVATVARRDNFSATLDVLNETANKSIIDTFIPAGVGKVLGVGKIVKDVFDKIDAANNREMIQLAINDFLVPSSADNAGINTLQEGYLVIFVKNEEEAEDALPDGVADTLPPEALVAFDDGFDNSLEVPLQDTAFVDIAALEQNKRNQAANEDFAADGPASQLEYDEVNKILRMNGVPVINTYLVFKVKKEAQRSENLNANWSKRFASAVNILAFEFNKTAAKLQELEPRVSQALSEGAALLMEDSSFTPADKTSFIKKYMAQIAEEKAKFS